MFHGNKFIGIYASQLVKTDPLSKCKATPSCSYFAIRVKICQDCWKFKISMSLCRDIVKTNPMFICTQFRMLHIADFSWAPGTNTSYQMSRDAFKFDVSSWPLTHLKFWKIMIALHNSQPQLNLPNSGFQNKLGKKSSPHRRYNQNFNSGFLWGNSTFPFRLNIITAVGWLASHSRCQSPTRMTMWLV